MPRMFTTSSPAISCGERRSGERDERAEAIAEPVFGEELKETRTSARAHRVGRGGLAQQVHEAIAQRCGVAGGNEPAGVAVDDDLAGRALGADARTSGAHRF